MLNPLKVLSCVAHLGLQCVALRCEIQFLRRYNVGLAAHHRIYAHPHAQHGTVRYASRGTVRQSRVCMYSKNIIVIAYLYQYGTVRETVWCDQNLA